MQPIPYGKQSISEEDIAAVVSVLRSDFLTQGPRVEEFEKAFAKYVGAKYAVAVCNATCALHMGVLALDLRPGDKVITTPITFLSSANCIRFAGGEVQFVDIDPETYLIDVNKLKALLENSPRGTYKGIIPVAFAGHPLLLDKLYELAHEYGLWILEDACHAPGARYKDKQGLWQSTGNAVHSDISVFSFHPVKHIASGEGGILTTNDERLYNKLCLLRSHGMTKDPQLLRENHGGWYYEMHELGYNYRLTDIQATLGHSQLKRAPQNLAKRRAIAQKYKQAFSDLGILLPKTHVEAEHAYHLFVIQVEDRKGLYDYLRERNVYPQVHYIPVHLQPYYQALGFRRGDFPVAEKYYARALSLPMYHSLSVTEQDYVIEKVLEFFS